jgi:hypothetical protein
MAPRITITKPLATAIATFVSIDNFIIFPFNYGGNHPPRFFWILRILHPFEVRRANGCQAQKKEGRKALPRPEARPAFALVAVRHADQAQ